MGMNAKGWEVNCRPQYECVPRLAPDVDALAAWFASGATTIGARLGVEVLNAGAY